MTNLSEQQFAHLDPYRDRPGGRPLPATSFDDPRPVHPEYAGAKCQTCGKKAIGSAEDQGGGHWSQRMTYPVCKKHVPFGGAKPFPRTEQ